MRKLMALFAVVAVALVCGCVTPQEPASSTVGTVYFSITDKQIDMDEVTEVEVTVDKIEVHMMAMEQEQVQESTQCQMSMCDCKCYPAGETPEELEDKLCGINCLGEFEVSGCQFEGGACKEVKVGEEQGGENADSTGEWVTVMDTPARYNLLALTGIEELMSTVELEAGDYNLIRLYVSEVTVVYNGEEQEAKLPSGKIDINLAFTVNANSSHLVSMDFELDKSLHITGDGTIIMAPVIKTEFSRNVELKVQNKILTRVRAEVRAEKSVGMDENGNVGEGLKINASADLEIGSDGKIMIKNKTQTQAQTHDVSARATGFSPARLTIQNGDTVRWIFRDQAAQRIVCEGAGADSSARYLEQTWSFVFGEPGTFGCYDALKPELEMTIIVEE
jgi:plastocyanin